MAEAAPDSLPLQATFDRQRAAFSWDTVPGVADRRARLKRLARLIASRKQDIVTAISADFGNRSALETLSAEVALCVNAARHLADNLERWARPRQVWNRSSLPGRATIMRQPKGVVGVISPWNYPFNLAVVPVLTALAAGNRVLLKPSELTPRTSALIASLFAEECDADEVSVITGGPDVGEAFSRLPFDHLFYTGSTRIGRLIAVEAAKNLTPVTLELGGKSPALALDDADRQRTARFLVYGKFFNAGQTCIAPDYLLVPEGTGRAWGDAVIGAAGTAWPDGAANADYTAIISSQHHQRITRLIEEARAGGATILQPDHDAEAMRQAGKVPPTVVLEPPSDCALMQEEIFGPVLPILERPDTDGMIAHLAARDHPLALYVFTKNRRAARAVLARTTSGGAAVNAANLHFAVEDLPFGGVGLSGHGAYHGERGFAEFSHERSVFEAPGWLPPRLLLPPYSRLFRRFIDWQIGK